MRHKRSKSPAGAALIEATLLLPLFLIFWFGIVDWGMTMWAHQSIVFNANQAARWAVVNGYDAAKIQKMVLYGDPESSKTGDGQFGIKAANVTVNLVCDDKATCANTGTDDPTDIRRVVIRVSGYRWAHFTPWLSGSYVGRDVVVSLPTEDLADGG
jgi:Flp pilus assembly protein TadG